MGVQVSEFGVQQEKQLVCNSCDLRCASACNFAHLLQKDVELAINNILEVLTTAIASGNRIEIRGFGGFSTMHRDQRISRNPKTGDTVSVPRRRRLHFMSSIQPLKPP